MPGLIHGLDSARIADNLEAARVEAGAEVEILVATKYVPLEEMGALAEAGVTLVGENRQQDLAAKHERYAADFTWDFIGNLQSRKVKQILPLVRLIHSVGTDSALEQLGRHGTPETEVLVEVNVAEEEGKGGVAPAELADFIARCPVRVTGLMTMPPFAEDPEASRPHFARLPPRAHPPPRPPPRRARRRQRLAAPVDGYFAGLAGRPRGGGDDHQARIRPL